MLKTASRCRLSGMSPMMMTHTHLRLRLCVCVPGWETGKLLTEGTPQKKKRSAQRAAGVVLTKNQEFFAWHSRQGKGGGAHSSNNKEKEKERHNRKRTIGEVSKCCCLFAVEMPFALSFW